MKDWKNVSKFVKENKFQFFFFIAMLLLLVITIIASSNADPVVEGPSIEIPDDTTEPENPDQNVVEIIEEQFIMPIKDSDYVIVRKFFDKNDTKENQQLSLIKFNNSYRTSQGMSFAKKDGTNFDVVAVLSGKVIEVKESPIYGKCVVIEHDDGINTLYYGLSEVCVQKDAEVKQKDKIGVSGYTEYDKEAKNHVYFQVMKDNKYLNPKNVFGKKTSEL